MRPTDIRLPGAVDLAAVKARSEAAAAAAARAAEGGAGGSAGALVVDVTEATFEQEVLERSRTVPVVVDFWADWCGPCKQLSPVLERLVAAGGGSWVLAKIDVDANQRLAAAFQVQSIPTVFAVIGGQPVPLFQGALPEQQIQPVIDEVLRVAAANGVTGRVAAGAADAGDATTAPGPTTDPVLAAAQDALAAGDLDAALASFRQLLERDPGDASARVGVARCELLLRTRGADEAALRAEADGAPGDVAAQLAVADLDLVRGQVEAAFDRLLAVVRRSAGDERNAARERLLALFDVLGPDDPRVVKGRRDLASALF